jgi:uncharacterized protein (DUF4415 family)
VPRHPLGIHDQSEECGFGLPTFAIFFGRLTLYAQLAYIRSRKSEKPMPDSRIDFPDIPESTDAELKRARRVGRPRTGQAKQLIAIHISPRLLAEIRRRAARGSMPYQTFIHEMLEKAATRAAA